MFLCCLSSFLFLLRQVACFKINKYTVGLQRLKIIMSVAYPRSSMEQATEASRSLNKSSQTVPHLPPNLISRRPSPATSLPASLMSKTSKFTHLRCSVYLFEIFARKRQSKQYKPQRTSRTARLQKRTLTAALLKRKK